ncbi:predicted protein [Nematostella vectensis]|uniref:Uncharacterized protein n=1 Tax=Nematostella vectensis TaxID=45351 RepID=A7RUZ9_NEMVE|nr:predicted protein [Nematostella vectensis]|eukprot:XP_001636764.1 predicted protein [Nematostella vectensis]
MSFAKNATRLAQDPRFQQAILGLFPAKWRQSGNGLGGPAFRGYPISPQLGYGAGSGPAFRGYAISPQLGYGAGSGPAFRGYAISPQRGYGPAFSGYAISPQLGYGPAFSGYAISPQRGYGPAFRGYAISPLRGYGPAFSGYAISPRQRGSGYAIPFGIYVPPRSRQSGRGRKKTPAVKIRVPPKTVPIAATAVQHTRRPRPRRRRVVPTARARSPDIYD